MNAISSEWGGEPGAMTTARFEVKAPAVTQEVTYKAVGDWLACVCRTPKGRLVKERLQPVLAIQRSPMRNGQNYPGPIVLEADKSAIKHVIDGRRQQ